MIFEALVDFIFPKTCVGCESAGVFLCKECRERLDFAEQICPECGEGSAMGWTHLRCRKRRGMDGLIAIYEYREPVMRAVIDGIKYNFNRSLIKTLLDGTVFETGEKFDALVPVPLHFYRENWRGFNQAEKIAEAVGEAMRVPVEKYLERIRKTKQQAIMKSKEEREENVRGAFRVVSEQRRVLKDKKVLLVDDVFTSGADMRECAKMLKRAGASMVWGLALAH